MSQSKLSRLADVSISTVQDLYHNRQRDPGLGTLERIANALQVEIGDLYEVLPDDATNN
ncbi:XRE family transcriptional regulator [Ktedonosporobacter rubrisoli]|uniref:XRE family transcriptional regulator n=2 Tax=Ktedonosporobacter rubrisoli TaxID=2509675 RepID=A0A4P6JZ13_KTERU|nr:XRE family transcriptional regulator [Ktedonosporobacter rubrisoli]